MSRRFAFYVLSPEGRLVHQQVEAADAQAARALVTSRGGGRLTRFRELRGDLLPRLAAALCRPSADEVAVAVRQLATLLDAGVPFLQATAIVAREQPFGAVRDTFRRLGEDVAAGTGIAASCERFPAVFSEVAVGLVAAAEADGQLSSALTQLADDLETSAADRRELIGAVAHPLVCLAAALGLTNYLGASFLPRIVDLYRNFDLSPPASVLAFASVSTFLADHGLHLIVGLAGLLAAGAIARRYPGVRLAMDRLLLALPMVGGVLRAAATSRFVGTFGRLHDRGVPTLRALDLSASVVGNRVMRGAIRAVEEEVRAGRPIAAALEGTGCFSPIAVSMAAVGEASGALGSLLLRAERSCREEWRQGTRRFLAVLRPVLLLVVGGAVLFLLSSLYAPILAILPRLGS